MRDEKEIRAAVETLRLTADLIQKNEDEKVLPKKQADDMRVIVDSTSNLLNWVLGLDVDNYPKSPVADKVIELAKGVNLFKDLE
jgi:hypothetical protein